MSHKKSLYTGAALGALLGAAVLTPLPAVAQSNPSLDSEVQMLRQEVQQLRQQMQSMQNSAGTAQPAAAQPGTAPASPPARPRPARGGGAVAAQRRYSTRRRAAAVRRLHRSRDDYRQRNEVADVGLGLQHRHPVQQLAAGA